VSHPQGALVARVSAFCGARRCIGVGVLGRRLNIAQQKIIKKPFSVEKGVYSDYIVVHKCEKR
jgi:hypothetical protein